YLARPLARREDPPPGVAPPQVASVEMDGGRMQIRGGGPDAAAGAAAGAAEPGGQAEGSGRSGHWREEKVGCLLAMESQASDVDPCPEIPASFIDPLRSLKLAQEIGHCAVPKGAPFKRAEPEEGEPAASGPPGRPGRRSRAGACWPAARTSTA